MTVRGKLNVKPTKHLFFAKENGKKKVRIYDNIFIPNMLLNITQVRHQGHLKINEGL
jgi:hypothetical protein